MNGLRRFAAMAAALALLLAITGAPGAGGQGIEQGTITVTKTWADGQEPVEVVEVCFAVTSDAAGEDVLADLCTADETYTVTFGPNEPAPLATGVTYYVWEAVGPGWAVTGDNPVEVVIPATTGEAFVTFENARVVDGTGAVEIHKRVCPSGAPASDIFTECHGYPPEQAVAFAVDGGTPVAVDASGNVVFTGLAAGVYTFSETEGPPLDFVDLQVYCSVQGDGGAAVELETDGPNFDVEVGADESIVCDVYNIPEDLKGDGEPVQPQPSGPSTLPGTGAGTTATDERIDLTLAALAIGALATAAVALRRKVRPVR